MMNTRPCRAVRSCQWAEGRKLQNIKVLEDLGFETVLRRNKR